MASHEARPPDPELPRVEPRAGRGAIVIMGTQSADDLRERMAEIRFRARSEATRLGRETRQFLDWKHYVRISPWGSLAVAAAVGFLAVPRRIHVTRPDVETLAKLAREQRLVVGPPEPAKRPGLMDSAFQLVANSLLRAGVAFVGQQIGKALAPEAGPPPGERIHEFAGFRR